MQRRNFIGLLGSVGVTSLCTCCTALPSSYTNLMSRALGLDTENLNAQAAKAYAELINDARKSNKLDNNSAVAHRIKTVFKRSLTAANQANKTGVPFAWEVNVIKADDLNAFAMPGGKMVFYTGIVDKLKLTDAEIATIMGHEMAHAFKEHGKQRIVQQQTSNLVLSTLQSQIGITGNANIDNKIYALSKTYALDLPFSRSNESEADSEGLFVMAKSGYNPQASIQLWQKMSKTSGAGNALTNFSSTHPSNSKRIDNLKKLIPQALTYYPAR